MKKGFTLVEIMIVVAIITLIAVISVPSLLSAKKTANTVLAQQNLKIISNALETYAAVNNGKYPTTEDDLTNPLPPYLNKQYCNKTIGDFTYECDFEKQAYMVSARPQRCSPNSDYTYSVSTGGNIVSGDCLSISGGVVSGVLLQQDPSQESPVNPGSGLNTGVISLK